MRIALGLEYDGTAYNGWQRQKTGTGVQALVEDALSRVANEAIEVQCAGRTDAGVHATAQVIHFDSTAERTARNWLLGINSNLPADICALWATFVDETFHARHSAAARRYHYLILNRQSRSALYRHRAWWVHRSLDISRMQAGAAHLIGEHDFSAFRAAGCQAATPQRNVHAISIARDGDWLSVFITANAFLQHMVRNMVGLLVTIGSGDESPDRAQSVLASRDRTQGGVAAPAHGLTLVAVEYPLKFGLQQTGTPSPVIRTPASP